MTTKTMVATTETAVELLSEASTAKFAGISLETLRQYRFAGKVKPEQIVEGLLVLYDPAAIREFFQTDPGYLINKARRAGKRVTATVAA